LPDVTDLHGDIIFINALYQDLLGRSADAAGTTYWMNQLLLTGSRSAVAQGLWDSPEHRDLEVNQFYLNLLHRPADPSGLAYWVNNMLAGKSEATVEADILASPEYLADHAGDAAFVTGLYRDVLGRAPDTSGQVFWLAQLQRGASTRQVIDAFISSPEALGRVVDGYYLAFLQRTADAPGRQYFLEQLLTGGSGQEEAVGVQILSSAEFFNDNLGG
jgi:hypothetical protein